MNIKKILAAKHQPGFTLIELMIIMAIIVSLTVIGASDYFDTRNKTVLSSAVERIAADVVATMERSKAQEDGRQWGIHFENPVGADAFYEIWSGSDYSSGIVANKVQLDSSIAFANPITGGSKDICFAKSTGLPVVCGTVGISFDSATVTGTGTTFTNDIGVGDVIRIPGWSSLDGSGLHLPKVSVVFDNNTLVLDFTYEGVSKSGLTMPLQSEGIVLNSRLKDAVGSIFVNANGHVNTQIKYGVVGYWGLDENSGNIASDYSGNSNTGTVTNAVIANGKIGRARNFNEPVGIHMINAGHKSELDLTTMGSFEFWAKPDAGKWATTSYNAFIDKARTPASFPSYRIQRYSSTNELQFYDGTNQVRGGSITPDAWNYIVVTVNKGTVKGYINAVEVFSGTALASLLVDPEADVLIGNNSEGEAFYGILDEVKIYNRVLGSQEILDHYNEYKEYF